MTSPTQNTLKALRKLGYTCSVLEKWNPFAHIRQDAFGFGDILAVSPVKILLVQCTSRSNHAARRVKILANETVPVWLAAGGHIEIWSWAKKKNRWEPKIEAITKPAL